MQNYVGLIKFFFNFGLIKILILFFFVIESSLRAVQYPVSPQEPTVQTPQVEVPKSPRGGKARQAQKTNVAMTHLKVRLHLGNKETITGFVNIPEQFNFDHVRAKISYKKTIYSSDIRSLVIEKYRSRKISTNGSSALYEFEPSNVRLELKNGQIYFLEQIFKDLRKIPIISQEGTTVLFCFFADSFDSQKGWSEVSLKEFRAHMMVPHPQAVVKIEYFEEVDKTGDGEAQEKKP